jgi:hypothetical protein
MSIQALHDVESLDRLQTYVQQKVAEEAKLRVHDHPPKTTAKTTNSPQRSQR